MPFSKLTRLYRRGTPGRGRRIRLSLGVAVVAVLALGFLFQKLRPRAESPELGELTYTGLLAALDAGKVDSLVVSPGSEIRGWWQEPVGKETAFRTVFSAADPAAVVQRAEAAGAGVRFVKVKQASRTDHANLLVSLVFLGLVGVFLVRQVQGTGGANTELSTNGLSTTTFAHVAGNEGVVMELREVVDFLRRPERFAEIGARTPKGVLMFGPPGTGKTLMARAVAGEADVPFYSISGSEVTGFIVGLGVRRITNLFRKARKTGGVIFIDEIDALGGRRGRNQSHNEDDRTLNQLLIEMDGFMPTEGVVVIAATNRADDLDPALLRAGRFDRSITVGLPTALEREAILRLHAEQRQLPLDPTVDLKRLARLMPQTNGADLANLLNEAAIAAVRESAPRVTWDHVEAARDRLLLGKERSGFVASDLEWRTVAIHEAGHAVAGVVCSPEDGLHKVTIQPRGRAMGVAFFSPDDDRHLHSRRYLEGQILKALGGRAAEELVFGAEAVTSGARSDLQQATRIAKDMIYHLGMGPETGLMIYDTQNGPVSGELHAAMDREVREILERSYARVREVIQSNRPALEALADALLEHETLDGEDALRLLQAHGLDLGRLQAA